MMWTTPTLWKVAATLTATLLAGTAWLAHSIGRQSGVQSTQSAWNLEKATQLQAQLLEQTKRRMAEQELVDAQEVHAAEIAAIRAQVGAARAAGRVDSGRVRDAARALAQRAGAQCADTTASELRASASDALNVLADVFSRAEQRATELAGIADDRGIAGRACEREYARARAALTQVAK